MSEQPPMAAWQSAPPPGPGGYLERAVFDRKFYSRFVCDCGHQTGWAPNEEETYDNAVFHGLANHEGR